MGLTKNQAEILHLIAEAGLFGAEEESIRIQLEADKAEAANQLRRHQLEDTSNFVNNFIVFDEEVSESSVCVFKDNLRRMTRWIERNGFAKHITIELNTPGGSIVDGFAMFDEIKRLRKQGYIFTVRVLGMAASMGAVLLQAADHREVGENSLVMIHRAAFGAIGKAYEVEDELEFVKKLEGKISAIFSERSGRPIEDFQEFFSKRKDLWFDAEEAVAAGLADEVC